MLKIVLLSIIAIFLTSCASSITDASSLDEVTEETCWCDVKYLRCETYEPWYKWNKCEKQWKYCIDE